MTRRLVGALLILMACAESKPVRALEAGQKLEVSLEGSSTDYFRGTYRETGPTASAGGRGEPGATVYGYLAYGTLNEKRGFALHNLCAASTADGLPKADPATRLADFLSEDAAYYWVMSARILPSQIDKVALDVTWEKWSRVGTGVPRQVGGGSRHIEMREGERSVLDYVSIDPSPSDYCAANVQIAVTAKVVEDPALAHESLAYGVWFEHADDRGQVSRRRAETIGSQGSEVPYRFEPVRLPIPGERFDDGTAADAILELSGSVRGRIQQDGSIVVDLRVGRWTGITRADSPRRGGIGDGGEKIFRMNPGESVRLTLPVPTGGPIGIERSTDANGNVVGPDDPNCSHCIKIYNPTFYKGSQDSIILTVDRVH